MHSFSVFCLTVALALGAASANQCFRVYGDVYVGNDESQIPVVMNPIYYEIDRNMRRENIDFFCRKRMDKQEYISELRNWRFES